MTRRPGAEKARPKTSALKVSVLIPCRNEVGSIEECLRNVFDFEAPGGPFEVIVIDGMSDDGTRETLERLCARYAGLRVLDNPQRTVPHAMNLGIRAARGEFIIRTDARCVHPRTYLKDLVALSESTGADNVGGVLEPRGTSYVQKSIAAAYASRISMGGALRERGDFVGETDAVYGGCFRRSRLIEVGMYDEAMVRNQDDELSFRLKATGGRVVQSGSIRVRYFPRSRFSQLFKQFLQYGYWKVAVLRRHPRQGSIRHLMPSLLILGLMALSLASILDSRASYLLVLYLGLYTGLVGMESARLALRFGPALWPGIFTAIVLIHAGFGTGFLYAIVSMLLGARPRYFESLSR